MGVRTAAVQVRDVVGHVDVQIKGSCCYVRVTLKVPKHSLEAKRNYAHLPRECAWIHTALSYPRILDHRVQVVHSWRSLSLVPDSKRLFKDFRTIFSLPEILLCVVPVQRVEHRQFLYSYRHFLCVGHWARDLLVQLQSH
ncbi:hypothetical protein L596_009118 [Steinernema carpocapsae]|uniref:Uncharacterized protein n=1 Tax=Steinernema carpocapsae TaxID=34508 RepID=A0A4U5PEU4_STECR|nr:hypothetical protein L596_009118 [Steinernema carpocapsae]